MQIVTMPVPAQEGITRDNVTVKVDAVVYYRVFDPVRVVLDVQNYQAAIAQVAQASLRSIIGKSDLDDLLSNRRSEEHTSELQSRQYLVCRLLLEKKTKKISQATT